MTRFKLDENLPQAAKAVLVSAGHDVHTAQSEGLAGQADGLIVQRCQAEGRVLVTLDLDFADIRLYPPATMPGVWVLRPRLQRVTVRGPAPPLTIREKESTLSP